jgi:hypothetical protein
MQHASWRDPCRDEFTLISGIGQVVNRRLHNAGVTTYAQLAALAVSDITALLADVATVTPGRISHEAWTDQAATLAATSSTDTPEPTPSEVGSRPAPMQPRSSATVDNPGPSRRSWSVAASTLTVERERRIVHASNTFTIFLTVDLAKAEVPSDVLYAATVLARPLVGTGQSTVIATAAGMLAAERSRLRLDSSGLAAGVYQLEAVVELFESSSDRPRQLLAGRENGVLMVVG